MTRYTDGSKGRIWNNVSAKGVNWLSDTIRDVSGEAITTVDRQSKPEKIHRIGFWSAINTITCVANRREV
jgi:hypothetical protein